MGGALTQAAILHCNRPELAGRIRQSLGIMQSSSPSYLLMASLDAWQAFLQEDGPALLRHANDMALLLADKIRALGGYRLWQDELPAGYCADPRKIVVSARDLGIDGYTLAELLRHEHRIDVELAALGHILLVVGLGLDEADICRMENALRNIRDRSGRSGKDMGKAPEKTTGEWKGKWLWQTQWCNNRAWQQGTNAAAVDENALRVIGEALAAIYRLGQQPWKPAISPREAFFAKRERIALDEAEGRVAAVSVIPYPPGIPALYPGMEIKKETIEAVIALVRTEPHCAGLQREGDGLYIEVVR
jgi:arginine/lysine/ornithine decarboxylase